jgi:hypothetical protein
VCGKASCRWDLGHLDGSNKQAYSGPEHACCNRQSARHQAERQQADARPPSSIWGQQLPSRIWSAGAGVVRHSRIWR